MNAFIQAAKSVVRKGDLYLRDKGHRHFHQKAAELLSQANFPRLYDYQLLMSSIHSSEFKTSQNFRFLEFSDFPITVARGENCFIDLYFWRRRPTVIHNHHFSGAFQCLQGSNVDLEFTFTPRKKWGKFHSLGDLEVTQVHSVKSGDIQPIAPLDRFIHQNHHHAELSVNLCFRTPDRGKAHLSNYLYSGLRFEKNPQLVERFERLYAAIQLESFPFTHIDFSIDDALYFLLQTEGCKIAHPQLKLLMQFFRERVKKEAKIDVARYLQDHEREFSRLEEQYD